MLKRADWQALQEAPKVASEPIQLELFGWLSSAPNLLQPRDLTPAHPVGNFESGKKRGTNGY